MEPLLKVSRLQVEFKSDFGKRTVTDDIAFYVNEGETLGIVGESGCGKSVTVHSILGLLPSNGRIVEGEALFDGKDLCKLTEKELDKIRGKDIGMVFQDALTALNPVFTVESQITEQIRSHLGTGRQEAREKALKLLDEVGIPDPASALKKYPHELSGGQRQRVMIAMALSCGPKLLIADEPTTALDVTIQAQIMELIGGIMKKSRMSMILITHDIGLIAQMADRVVVMYAGQIIEEADVHELFKNPLHPYTKALLDSAPSIDDGDDRVLKSIKGAVPEDYTGITGCRFADRCELAEEGCRSGQDFSDRGNAHYVRCRIAGAAPVTE